EAVTRLPPVTWRQDHRVGRVLQDGEPGVLHLHGYWDEAESVVLGYQSYEEVLRNAHAQAVPRALAVTGSLLFVGCGAGLEDPNFEKLLEWIGATLSGAEHQHYLLAREPDVVELRRRLAAWGPIQVLSFGPDFADLAGFLRGLTATSTVTLT